MVNPLLPVFNDRLLYPSQLGGERNGLGRREKRPKKIGRREKGRKKNREMGELALRGRTENVLKKM